MVDLRGGKAGALGIGRVSWLVLGLGMEWAKNYGFYESPLFSFVPLFLFARLGYHGKSR